MDGSYVVLDDDDFEAAAPKKSQLIEIEEFALEAEIESVFFETPYYLGPEKGGGRPYRLLHDALEKTKKVAIGTYVMRGKENLCLIKPKEGALVLVKLRFAEEIRSLDDLDLPAKSDPKPAELKMAISLIDQLSPKKFSLDKYKDTYDAELMKIIEAKAKGTTKKAPKFKMVKSKTKDLMEQLKASLEGKKKSA